MRPSPLLSAAAAASLLVAIAGPATAATTPLPAAGIASSTVTLLDVAAGGRTLSAGTLSLLSDALGADAVAKILATPLTVDGVPYGQRTITPTSSPQTVNPLSSALATPALQGLASLTSPAISGTATEGEAGPATRVGVDDFGGLTLLGLPVTIDGTLDAGSLVNRTTGAEGDKTLEVTDLALPSIADLLAALGLDLAKLPTDVLVELLGALDLLTPVVTAADKAVDDARAAIQTQIDAAQKTVDDATAALAAKTTELTAAQNQLTAKQAELTAANAALAPLNTALASAQAAQAAKQTAVTTATTAVSTANGVVATAAGLLGQTVDQFVADFPANPIVQDLVAARATLTSAQADLTAATAVVTTAAAQLAAAQSAADVLAAAVTALQGTVATLQGVVNTLQGALDAALAVLRGVLKDVLPLVAQLLAAITTVLDGTPLVSIDGLRVVTESTVTSATAGGQTAKIVGGEVTGLEVLGTDVLSDVLGSRSVDVLDLAGSTLAEVNGLVAELTGTLSEVLSTVPGFPALSIPAPNVTLLTKASSTGITDGFGTAGTSIRALSVTLPSITLPQALALPSAAGLPAFDTLFAPRTSNLAVLDAVGNLVSSPITVAVGTLSEQARFRAAAAAPGTVTPGTGTPGTGTPTTGTPGTATPGTGTPTTLPRTGASAGLAALAMALMGAAFVTRRRSEVLEG